MTPQGWGYRPALDGLRTVAVYLVVLFHSGVEVAAGGFVGVDVFFVLSGFLVTNVLLAEHRSTGGVRLAHFYARRIRRLLPAAVLVVVSVCALTVLVEPRLARTGFIDDARSALLYVANWHFSAAATDYFADDIGRSPFLHFWSLAIEEQFYLIFPLLLVGLLLLGRRLGRPGAVPVGLAVCVALSLGVQLVVARSDPLDAYYATPARLYQLLAGALLASAWNATEGWRGRRRASRAERSQAAGMLALLGLVVITFIATNAIGLSASSRGVVVTISAVWTIAMLELAPGSASSRVLSTRTMTSLGRISYGTYLWHWPMIVLLGSVAELRSYQVAVIVGVGATALAAVSFHLVESPIRRARVLAPRPRSVVTAGLSLSVAAAVLVVPHLLESRSRPWLARQHDTVSAAASTGAARAALAAPVPAELDLAPTEPPPIGAAACSGNPLDCIVHTAGTFHVTLLGDSNARVLAPVLRDLAERYEFTLSVVTRVGCPWQTGLGWNASDRALVADCVEARNEWYERILPTLAPDLIVATHVPRDPQARTDGVTYERIDGGPDGPTMVDVFAAATASSLDELTRNGSSVVLLEPLPYAAFDPTECLSGAELVGDCAYRAATVPFPSESIYRAEATRRSNVYAIDYDTLACPFLPVCVPMINGQLVFRNQFHLGNAWLVAHGDELWELMVASGALD